jgi:hypothetical protein
VIMVRGRDIKNCNSTEAMMNNAIVYDM